MPKNKLMEGPPALPEKKWFDSHCHLDSLESSPEEAVASAQSAGVAGVVTVGTDLSSSAASVALAARFPSVWAAVGIHPHEARHVDDAALSRIEELAGRPRVVAIGEIGLDFFRDHSPRSLQVEAFRRQLDIAGTLGKPVVLHIREAHPEVFGVLEAFRHNAGLVFHCFSAGPEEVQRAIDLGGYVSFAGNISYKKSELIQQAARHVPLDRLLLETDSPYLAPAPHRGKQNSPALAPEVGKALADAIGCPIEQIAQATRANAGLIFGLEQSIPDL